MRCDGDEREKEKVESNDVRLSISSAVRAVSIIHPFQDANRRKSRGSIRMTRSLSTLRTVDHGQNTRFGQKVHRPRPSSAWTDFFRFDSMCACSVLPQRCNASSRVTHLVVRCQTKREQEPTGHCRQVDAVLLVETHGESVRMTAGSSWVAFALFFLCCLCVSFSSFIAIFFSRETTTHNESDCLEAVNWLFACCTERGICYRFGGG